MLFPIIALGLIGVSSAYPWVASQPGIKNRHLLGKRQQPGGTDPGGEASCPYNPNHVWPTPSNDEFPYAGAINGIPGTGVGGYQVPAPGDTAHEYIAPTEQDIRGPCPGLNAAANHGFIARDGITNYTELVDAVQNVYNMGYDLANFLAVFSIIIADGDLVTKKLSIGCDATSRTSYNVLLSGDEPGLDGHNKFEADTSLTRDDYFLGDGDNFSFNGTLFGMMTDTTGGVYDLDGLALYRFQRYEQSRLENPEFFFGPLGVFTHGAASFIYELFPNYADGSVPNLANTESFFGAELQDDGTYTHVPERIPDNWYNRAEPYYLLEIAGQIAEMYGMYPVGFGGNVDGEFVGLDFPPYINDGNFSDVTAAGFACFLYQLVSGPIPSGINSVVTPSVEALEFVLEAIGGSAFENLGCSLPETKR